MDTIRSLVGRLDWGLATLVWSQVKLIGTAVGILYVGAHASLGRPPSAAPRKKRDKAGKLRVRDEDKKKHMESLQNSDAIVFPAMAAVVLVSLYYLLQKYPAMVNTFLRWYIGVLSLASLATMYSHGLQLVTGFLMPGCVRGKDGLLYVVGLPVDDEDAVDATSESDDGGASASTCDDEAETEKHRQAKRTKASRISTAFIPYGPVSGVPPKGSMNQPGPVPLLSLLPDSQKLRVWLWGIRPLFTRPCTLSIFLPAFGKKTFKFPIQHVVGGLAAALTVWSYQATNWTVFSNLIGLAGCYSSMLIISPTKFSTGSLILAGLFVYDIIMVFYTNFMIGVATQLDVPIKLTITTGPNMKNILGLGDIVVPGMMIGLALRFDLWKYYHKQAQKVKIPLSKDIKDPETGEISTIVEMQDSVKKPVYREATGSWGDWFWSKTWGELLTGRLPSVQAIPDNLKGSDFPKTYFNASIVGYSAGMLLTLGVLLWSRHGQPALLYLVPSVVGSIALTAWARGELKALWFYTEDGSLDKEDVVVDVGPDGQRVDSKEKSNGLVEGLEKPAPVRNPSS